jgi:hypothetical protein
VRRRVGGEEGSVDGLGTDPSPDADDAPTGLVDVEVAVHEAGDGGRFFTG